MEFEWDEDKAATNERKHGVTFVEAMTVFGDQLSISALDPDHSVHEDRSITMGMSSVGRLLIVSHVDEHESCESSPLGRQPAASVWIMEMEPSPETAASVDELRPEYDFRSLRGNVRGKYAAQYQQRLQVVRHGR